MSTIKLSGDRMRRSSPSEADSNQLEAALLNIAINSRDAMPDGGKITIEATNIFADEEYCRANLDLTPGQYAMISVSDTGCGMPADVVDRAFEPFFTTKELGQGTGLGLSQVYGFVKQSGGQVKIYSEVGQGTTVKIYLPRYSAHAVVDDKEEGELPIKGEQGESILIVEDDADLRVYLIEVLRGLGYRVVAAGNAKAALSILEQASLRIDLLLTDIVMPGVNGRELAGQAQQIRPMLRVLYMTGYSRNAVVHQGRLDHGVNLLQKPITQVDLASRIRELLDQSV
jgi:CheY-like chemotaxis protein